MFEGPCCFVISCSMSTLVGNCWTFLYFVHGIVVCLIFSSSIFIDNYNGDTYILHGVALSYYIKWCFIYRIYSLLNGTLQICLSRAMYLVTNLVQTLRWFKKLLNSHEPSFFTVSIRVPFIFLCMNDSFN